ncbi:MAG: hypothetical protein CMJ80_16140 [Planctomycetaceae bacterium]|nr:hypothetical protein [Planctomycetaceae bacterium]
MASPVSWNRDHYHTNAMKRRLSITFDGRILVLGAALLWSTSGLFVKAPWFTTWPIETRGTLLAFWRTLFAGVILLPWVRQPVWTVRLIPATLCFAIMNVTYLTAVTQTTAANAIWLQSTAPVWVFLISVGAMHEAARRADYGMFLMVVVGVGFILWHEIGQLDTNAVGRSGVLMGLVSGMAYAGVVISVRALRDLESTWLIALNHLVTAAILLPFVLSQTTWPVDGQWGWLVAFGVLQMGLPYVLFAIGLRSISGHQASFIVLIEPVLVPLWVWLAWHRDPMYQPPAWWTFVGGAIILAGLIVSQVGPSRKRSRSSQ